MPQSPSADKVLLLADNVLYIVCSSPSVHSLLHSLWVTSSGLVAWQSTLSLLWSSLRSQTWSGSSERTTRPIWRRSLGLCPTHSNEMSQDNHLILLCAAGMYDSILLHCILQILYCITFYAISVCFTVFYRFHVLGLIIYKYDSDIPCKVWVECLRPSCTYTNNILWICTMLHCLSVSLAN